MRGLIMFILWKLRRSGGYGRLVGVEVKEAEAEGGSDGERGTGGVTVEQEKESGCSCTVG
jgi:hypothetical protein